MDIRDKIVTLRKEYNLTQKELGKIAGVSGAAVSAWELGDRSPKIKPLRKICAHFGIDIHSFIDEEAAPPSTLFSHAMSSLPQMREWPVLGATACGTPLHRELLDETVLAPDDIKADVVFRCVGDSMINARIFNGDAVFVRSQPKVENGQIAVVRTGEEYTLKRVYVHDEYVELRPENPMYEAITLRDNQLNPENFEIVGLAVAFLSAIS